MEFGHLLIGKTGKYRLETRVGSGATGNVYRATHTRTQQKVAIKIAHPTHSMHPSFVRRFKREFSLTARLSHAHNVQVIEQGEDRGTLFIVMELIEGTDLGSYLAKVRWLAPSQAIALMLQICRALAVAHRQGIVHRDIKPENILLTNTPNAQAKLCDFGMAKRVNSDNITETFDEQTLPGVVVGTPAYMSPEQARGEVLDLRSDIYACGVLLYRMVTGRAPFDSKTSPALLRAHTSHTPRPASSVRPTIGQPLSDLIDRAMTKKKEARIQSVDAFIQALVALQNDDEKTIPDTFEVDTLPEDTVRLHVSQLPISTTPTTPTTPTTRTTPPTGALRALRSLVMLSLLSLTIVFLIAA